MWASTGPVLTNAPVLLEPDELSEWSTGLDIGNTENRQERICVPS